MALTWRNVDAPDFSAGNQLLAKSGDTLANSIAGIGGAMQHYRSSQVEGWSKDAIAKAQGLTDLASFDAAVKDGSIYGGRAPSDLSAEALASLDSHRNALQDQANKDAALTLQRQAAARSSGGRRGGGATEYIPAEFNPDGSIVEGTGINVPTSDNGGGSDNGGSTSGSRSSSGRATNTRNYQAEADVEAKLGDLAIARDQLDPTSPTYRNDLANLNAQVRAVRGLAVNSGYAPGVAEANAPLIESGKADATLATETRNTALAQEFWDRSFAAAGPNGLTAADAATIYKSMTPEEQKKYKEAVKTDPTAFGHDAFIPAEQATAPVALDGQTVGAMLAAKDGAKTNPVRQSPGSILAAQPFQLGNNQTQAVPEGAGNDPVVSPTTGTVLGFGNAIKPLPSQQPGRVLSFGSNVPVLATDEQHNQDVNSNAPSDYGITPNAVYDPVAIDQRASDEHNRAAQYLQDSPIASMESFRSDFSKTAKGGDAGPDTQAVAKQVYDKLNITEKSGWAPPDVEQVIRDTAAKYGVDFNTAAAALASSPNFNQNNFLWTSAADAFTDPLANFADFTRVDKLLKGYNDPEAKNNREHIQTGMSEVTKEYSDLLSGAKKAGATLKAAQLAFNADPSTKHNDALAEAFKIASGYQDKVQAYDYSGKLRTAADPKQAAIDAAAKAEADKAKADAITRQTAAALDPTISTQTGQKLTGRALVAVQGQIAQREIDLGAKLSGRGQPVSEAPPIALGRGILPGNVAPGGDWSKVPPTPLGAKASLSGSPDVPPGVVLGGPKYTAPLMEQSAKDFSSNKKVVGDILLQRPDQISYPEYQKLTPAQRVSKKLPPNFHGSALEWRNLIARL